MRQLRFEQAFRQHKAERSPHIAPMLLVGVDGILHQIVGVLIGRIGKLRSIQLRAAAAVAVVDLDRAARRTGSVAAVGVARDHRVDVRGIFLVLVGDGSADCHRSYSRWPPPPPNPEGQKRSAYL